MITPEVSSQLDELIASESALSAVFLSLSIILALKVPASSPPIVINTCKVDEHVVSSANETLVIAISPVFLRKV